MRRRILAAILSVATVAIILFGVPLAVVVQRFVNDDATLRVERQAVLASREVPADFADGSDPVELPATKDAVVLALYDPAGLLVAGTGPAHADAATMQALSNRVVDAQAAGLRIVAVPVAADERVVGAIRAEQSTAASGARTRKILGLLAALAAGVLAVGAAIGYVLAGRLARPVRTLRDAAVQLGDGDFTVDVARSGVPELDQAGQAMTATARRLDDLVARERAFSADASHQLRTPLTGLRAAIETELALPRTDRTLVLHEALSDIDRLERTITELLTIARTSTITDSPVSLGEVLAEVEQTWREPFAKTGRLLVIASARSAPSVRGNAEMLRHALDVLVENSLKHGQGTVAVEHAVTDNAVTVSVTDEGPGFRYETKKFDPLHGLGLPLAQRLVEALPGRLVIVQGLPTSRVEILLQR